MSYPPHEALLIMAHVPERNLSRASRFGQGFSSKPTSGSLHFNSDHAVRPRWRPTIGLRTWVRDERLSWQPADVGGGWRRELAQEPGDSPRSRGLRGVRRGPSAGAAGDSGALCAGGTKTGYAVSDQCWDYLHRGEDAVTGDTVTHTNTGCLGRQGVGLETLPGKREGG